MRRNGRIWWWFMEKKDMALVLITITMMLQFQIKECVGCLETERIGLLQLKSYLENFLSPQDESILKSWSDDRGNSECCLWERINCSDAIGGHIVELSLSGIMPYTYMPRPLNLSLFHSYPQLKTLDFSWNWISHLFDPIHGYKSFQRLEKLKTLDFYANQLNNSALPFLSAARSLRTLNLGENELKGVSPPNELANMTELRVLILNQNNFNSFYVPGLVNLRELEVLDLLGNGITDVEACDELRTTKLKTLDLSINKFSEAARLKGLKSLVELRVLRFNGNDFNHSRSIEVLKDMSKLQELDLSGNGFTDLDSLGLVFPSSLQVLDLSWNQLSSTPKDYSEICRLTSLRELNLRGTAFPSMPYCLGNLSRLRTLDLSKNQLNGNLSSFVSGLPSTLEYLSLLDNNFNGSFLFKSLVNQTRLTVFKLSSNVGMIQAQAESSWVPLFQLKELILWNVNLGSNIPSFLVHQHELGIIDLSGNKLTGAFPTWLVQNNTRLQTLLLNSNSLTKLQLPNLVHGLQALEISRNRIYDSIQEDIGIVFPELRYLKLASNHFHGTIPPSMGEMKSLEWLDVSSNGLYGQLPKNFLSSCYSLEVLKLSNNQFQGSLGEGLLKANKIRYLDLSGNSFSGTLPHSIGKMSILGYLNMSGNQLKGPFPRLLLNLSQLEVIDISRNSFSGSIPRNLDFPSLLQLRLQSNGFIGSIPDTLFKAEGLEVLDLGNNGFSEMVLNANGKRSGLHVLLLRNNSFQSHILKTICQLGEIGLLDLSHNKLKGGIPSCLGNMSFGRQTYSLEGYGLSFTGLLPSCHYASHLNYLESVEYTDMQQATIVEFFTKNRDEAYQGDILDDMYGLDLSSNKLSGEIPVEIGKLESIRSLNLSNNHLTGFIPYIISKLEDLESLDLSNNKLDGNIPPQLADLNSLGYFNVSFNNLSGEIPFKGHLGTFVENSYIGNAHLCGLPTKKSCNPVREPSASKQTSEEDEEEGDGVIDMVWFYWTCGLVYISTVMALFAFLCIDLGWSREWFYRVDLLVHHVQRFKRSLVSN